MKNFIRFAFAALVALAAVSCDKPQRSTATFVQVTSFNMDDYSIENYFHDGIMFSPTLTWDDVSYYNSLASDLNTGFLGGFRVSVRKASDEATTEQAKVTSADPLGGSQGSNGYMVFTQFPVMPDFSIAYDLSGFYTAALSSYGCDICNTLYNKRLGDEGLISPGDYLKVKAEFYRGTALIGSIEKYLIDYATVTELKMENEWTGWTMAGESGNSALSGFDSVKLIVESSGDGIDPAFCLDNYCVHMSVEY
ncbi:MAG: hypothetical protein IJ840_08110 [Bacteroidales bacterium]|nr:hypothetical protein [Bacteroidales bacterium]